MNVGDSGESIVASFINDRFSNILSFLRPKTRSNAEVADVLIWMNRLVILIEVKTRGKGAASIDRWAGGKIDEAVSQIRQNRERILNSERISLHNKYFNTMLDCAGVNHIKGVVILVHDGACSIYPSHVVQGIYEDPLPVHVFSLSQLVRMKSELDTIPDFNYYLSDRLTFVRDNDIPLDHELDAMGLYKANANHFPKRTIDVSKGNLWDEYRTSMKKAIALRDAHNRSSKWLDGLMAAFTDGSSLYEGIPIGLYYIWEIESISRRERAYLGEKFTKLQEWFESGHDTRQFAFLNQSTGNWLLFYFAAESKLAIRRRIKRLIELKVLQERLTGEGNSFAVYAFGGQVSRIYPRRMIGLACTMIVSATEVRTDFIEDDIEDSFRIWGDPEKRKPNKIEEFPNPDAP